MDRRAQVMEVVAGGLLRPVTGGAAVPIEGAAPVGALVLAHHTAGRGFVTEVLARAGSARAAMVRVAVMHGLPLGVSLGVEREVSALVEAPGIDAPELVDLTALPFVTIDGAGARDLDQAVHIQRSRGGYVVRYAIADASHFVRPGTALFDDALARGASYYLPGLTVPMLPRALSEDIVSLCAGVPRRALVILVHLDQTGRRVGSAIQRARILSRAALCFEEVQGWHDAPESSPLAGQPYCSVLDLLREVGRLRLAEARQRDVVTYQRAELEVRIGEEGFGFVVVADARTDVELYNEQISLLCNVEGARLIAARGARAAYRVHPSPPDARLFELERLIVGIVAENKLDPAVWRWRRRRTPSDSLGEPLSDYLLRIRELTGHERVLLAIERLAMVSNVRSEFAPEPGPHYGIGAAMYARLTAPMREMVGVHTHAVALSALGVDGWGDADSDLLERIIETANRARAVQRELTKAANKVVIDSLLAADRARPLGERPWRRTTIVELRPTRAYVQLDDPPIELKLYDDDLGPTRELLRGGAAMRIGARRLLRVGAPVDLRVFDHDARRDRWRFEVRIVRDGEPGRRMAHSAGRIPTE